MRQGTKTGVFGFAGKYLDKSVDSKMTFNNYLPPKIYTFLVKIAEEHKLSVKEVQRIFLTKVAVDLGFTCDDERIGSAKSDGNPYCKDCWARLRKIIREPYVLGGKWIKNDYHYVKKETFLDEFYQDGQETSNKRKKEMQDKPLDDHTETES